MTQYQDRSMMFRMSLLVVCLLGMVLKVRGGGDPSCPSDNFPLRLTPGGQAVSLESTTLYSEASYLSTPLVEIVVGERINLWEGFDAVCEGGNRWVYVTTRDGSTGWALEVFLEAYTLAPFGAAPAPLSVPTIIEPEVFPAGQVDYNGVHLLADSALATQIDAQFVPVSDMRGYDPAHLEFRLTDASGLGNFMVIRVMSAQEVDNYYPGTMMALRAVLDGAPGAEIPFDLTWMFSNAQKFGPPHEGVVPLGNGRAYWSLGREWQDELAPTISNELSIFGLTDDGQYYIQATFIIAYNQDTSIYTPPTENRDDPNIDAIIDSFHQGIFDRIATAADSDFTPPPSQIHALLSSLTIDPGTLQAIVSEANMMADAQPASASIPSTIAAPIPFPEHCPDSPPSRIQVGDTARVTYAAAGEVRQDLRVRASAAGERIGAMAEGTEFRVIDGHICANDMTWWQIETLDRAITGWVAEGAAPDDYYIEPLPN